jgi:DNA mismatch endonuclease, patch repair protein
MDTVDEQKRSWIMSRIPGKNTKPETRVRSALHRLGYRFRIHRNDLPGRPDIVLPSKRTVILVHGCFWHRHSDCRLASNPKSNVQFWRDKFDRNVRRDQKNMERLRGLGWRTIVVWECETKNWNGLVLRVSRLMCDDPYLEILY